MSDKECSDYYRIERGGHGLEGWVMTSCECGWKGHKHYAHNDYQFSNWRFVQANENPAREEWERHVADRHKGGGK